MQRDQQSSTSPLGSELPTFSLVNIDNKEVGAEYLREGKAALVAFTCNHCPYVKGSEEMLIKIVKRFQADGLRAVTINSNDALQYPEDGFEGMQEKAAAMNLPYPYLHDESQSVANINYSSVSNVSIS